MAFLAKVPLLSRYQAGWMASVLTTLGIDLDYIGKFRVSAGLFVALFVAAWGALAYVAFASNMPVMSGHAPEHASHGGVLSLMLMVPAMMLPMIAGHLLHIARSLNPRHRLPAMSFFFVCYTGGWVLLLMGALWLASALSSAVAAPFVLLDWLAIALFIAAGFWGKHPANKAFRNRCGCYGVVHVTGFKVYRSMASYAGEVWLRCVLECGLVMVAMVLMVGHSLLLMVLMTALLLTDRYLVVSKNRSVSDGWIAIGVWLLVSQVTGAPHPF